VPDVCADTAGPATGVLRVALGIPHERLRHALADWLEQSGRISVVHRQADGNAAGAAARRTCADVVVLGKATVGDAAGTPLPAVLDELGGIPLVIVGLDGSGAYAEAFRAGGAADYLVLDMEIDALVDALWRAAAPRPVRPGTAWPLADPAS
jgi:DNA-binding NarL/FixJ family response regulator